MHAVVTRDLVPALSKPRIQLFCEFVCTGTTWLRWYRTKAKGGNFALTSDDALRSEVVLVIALEVFLEPDTPIPHDAGSTDLQFAIDQSLRGWPIGKVLFGEER